MLENIFKINNKANYQDISKLYNIVDVIDGSIVTKTDVLKYVYVYKIEPAILINITKATQDLVVTKYIEFLRETNFDFEIYIKNQKTDINKYFKIMDKNSYTLDYDCVELYKQYKQSMNQLFFNQNIYTKVYYILISLEQKDIKRKKEFEQSIFKLKDIGCEVENLNYKQDLQVFLYNSINKKNIEMEQIYDK